MSTSRVQLVGRGAHPLGQQRPVAPPAMPGSVGLVYTPQRAHSPPQTQTNRSGSMSGVEVKEMLLELDLENTLGVSKEDVAAFVDEEFQKARVE